MSRVSRGRTDGPPGLRELERLLEMRAKAGGEGFPPYNIEQTSDRSFRISLAVAGFREEDLSVSLEGGRLVIRGQQPEARRERVYLHRGIAARRFQRSFVLADGVEVGQAVLEHGLLHVDLAWTSPERSVRKIAIRAGRKG